MQARCCIVSDFHLSSILAINKINDKLLDEFWCGRCSLNLIYSVTFPLENKKVKVIRFESIALNILKYRFDTERYSFISNIQDLKEEKKYQSDHKID